MEKYILPPQERSVLERLKQPFAVYQFVDKRVVTLALSDGFCELFGYEDRAQAVYDMDNDMYKQDHPDDVARIANAAFRFATEGGKYDVVYRTKIRGTPDYRIVHAFGEHIYTESGVRLAHVWYSDEGIYTEGSDPLGNTLNQALSNALHENSIVQASQYDALTGLPSMTRFFDLAEEASKRVRLEGKTPVLLYMDLCGMKFFNSRHGFSEGDRLLQAFAKILSDTFGNEQSCRIGADHFAVMTLEAEVDEKLRQMFHAFQNTDGGKTLPLHVGVYVGQAERVHISVACDRARLACGALRSKYGTAVYYYRQELSEGVEKRQYIIETLDRAIAEKWIQVYIQPIIRAVNGCVCDAEALARWIDPEKGPLSPADFIPALENSGLIYKLDLYMLDQVLESIQAQKAAGFSSIPHSINISRSDFDVCDIVEEFRRRVDGAGIPRDRIAVEITESVIGSDFDFIREQVERFRELGFPVWMDDFGSGYSSLDALQSVQFDLIKFDISFMRKLNDGSNGKTLLIELMRMATSLGMDTLCEGVENAEQARFLQEIGCSKLQGYYFSRPIPFETLKEMRASNSLIERENTAESAYYESIGRVNLYDLGAIAGGDESSLHNTFNTLPMAILETRDGVFKYVRSNASNQDFIRRLFHIDIIENSIHFTDSQISDLPTFVSAIRQCGQHGSRTFFDERMPDGSVVHALARRINTNPVTGSTAVGIAILSITEPEEATTYADIARALAADYYNLFVVDLDTNDYIEYSSPVGGDEMTIERHGEDFFESARRDTMKRIYEEDREQFLSLFTKEKVLLDLERQGVFTTTYRLIDTGTPMYVNMKITRMHSGNRIILGISIIDAHMKQLEKEKKLLQEKLSLGRVAALSPSFIVLYTVDPVTNHYTQYSPSKEFESFGLAKQGEDFFADVVLDAPKAIAPEDMERHLRVLTKENMLRDIRLNGFFLHSYRLILDGQRVPVCLRATLVREPDGDKIILGVTNDDKAEFRSKLEEAQKIRELNRTITSLLDNMPALTFTKDARTGVYLACNQAFAIYARKTSPAEVAGLTDAEIFDAETAAHFVQDDQIALSRSKPYVFFEDVPDAAGEQRQFQTTKLKYTDSSGRACLLGMCHDVTDVFRMQRENAAARMAYIKARDTSIIFTHIAHALARGCTDLYYVNLDTAEFIEFHTDDENGVLGEVRRGTDFFAECGREARLFVYEEDRAAFVRAMDRQFLEKALRHFHVYELTYRRLRAGVPFYVNMRITRMEDDPRFIVIAVSDIDELMRNRRAEERIREERIVYARLHALTGNFLCVYVVDPETDRYREFSSTQNYEESFAQAKEGENFFHSVENAATVYNHPEDLNRFLSAFTKENVLAEIERSGIFTLGYRIMMDGRPVHVQMKAAMVEEREGRRLIVGLNDIDAQVRQEEEYSARLAQARTQANLDALTGVNNKHAYMEAEARINRRIAEGCQRPFDVVVFDVNDLKKVNDSLGHQAGDQYLRDASRIICGIFRHSSVYRIGGDEFAVITHEEDHPRLAELLEKVREHNEAAERSGGIVIACGTAEYDGDKSLAGVFIRADRNMFENKRSLKAGKMTNK